MGGFLSAVEQIAIKAQADPLVAEVLVAADAAVNIRESSFEPTGKVWTRGIKRASLSKQKDLRGCWYGRFSGGFEFTGGGPALADRVPTWDAIRGCGFVMTIMKKVVCDEDTVPASWVVGRTFGNANTLGGSTATGKIMARAKIAGKVRVVYIVLTGVFADNDVINVFDGSGDDLPGTLTVNGAPVDGGPWWKPRSRASDYEPTAVQIEFRDTENIDRMIGARGNVTIDLTHGQVPLFNCTFEGPMQMQDTNGTPIRGGLLANVPAVPAPKFLMGDIGFPMLLDEYSPIVSKMMIELNNTLSPEETIGESGIIAYLDEELRGGYGATQITGRDLRVTLDPKRPVYTSFDFRKRWHSNAEFPFYTQVGRLVTAGDNALVILGPKANISGESLANSDRNGDRAYDISLGLNGDSDDELIIANPWI